MSIFLIVNIQYVIFVLEYVGKFIDLRQFSRNLDFRHGAQISALGQNATICSIVLPLFSFILYDQEIGRALNLHSQFAAVSTLILADFCMKIVHG